jgi:hypothetical protein
MTDIWRGFVAQRCLWELGYGVVFHGAEVAQARNEHRLIDDFADELPGYLNNRDMVRSLARLRLDPGRQALGDNLVTCYRLLVEKGWVGPAELDLVYAWLRDVQHTGFA